MFLNRIYINGLLTPIISRRLPTCRPPPKRFVTCNNGCGIMNLWAEEQSQHEAHDCDTRHMPCPNKGCGRIDIPFKDLHSHSTRTCDYRPVPCALDCGLSIPLVQKRRGGAGRENETLCILCACVPL